MSSWLCIRRVEHLLADFSHLAEQGFRKIQINWAHFTIWKPQHLEQFSAGLHQLGAYLQQCWSNETGPWLVNWVRRCALFVLRRN